jgi:NAD(P)-dependent dehydrogenase (short-subunit alcohol dehydrogenase family)
MEPELSGKVALVTGSSRNLGGDIAVALAGYGAQVAIHYNRSEEQARNVARRVAEKSGIAEVFQADVSSAQEVHRLAAHVLDRFGQVDILVNNVGPYSDIPFLKLPAEVWESVLNSGVKAAYVLAQVLAPGMKERGWGRIVNISAASAFVRVHSVYGLAKAALIHLTESLAVELAPEISVNAIAPGQIEESEEIDQLDPTYKARLREATPMRRLVTRSEIATTICLLCSGLMPSMTGQTLVLDGGWSLPVGRATPSIGTVM